MMMIIIFCLFCECVWSISQICGSS